MVRAGEHACCRFAHALDRRQVAISFVHDALARSHKVIYLCEHEDLDALGRELAGDREGVARALEGGQLELRSAPNAYAPDSSFDIERVLEAMHADRDRTLAEGYPGLSITGEMGWLHRDVPGYEQLPEYERRFADLMAGGDVVALCQYAHGEFEPATLADVAAAHTVDLAPELAALVRTGCLAAARVDDGRMLRLAGELDFACADTLVSVLAGHFHGPLQLDLAELRYVDVAGMRAIRGRTGQRLTISGASSSVRRLVGLLGWDTDPGVELLG